MSSIGRPDRTPLIALVRRADRALQDEMVREAHQRGRDDIKPAHNAVFSILGPDGDRAANLAARAGITRQSMGEVVRDLVGLGILEMVPDPHDRRAKLVRYSEAGKAFAESGYRHITDLERRFEEEFGEDYAAARRVLERLVTLLAEVTPEAQG
ncbi:MarR family winged helix-turn-helix transcriptional regulator [Nocardioides sp.]|uniref:MarR family winged helix-turn-helix transcriptional regulator n=1 Tax=Nocardioides sp. TaxID=35761 RepID=UPI0031FED0E0|nr:MarR family protein [Nocardioides sp.]